MGPGAPWEVERPRPNGDRGHGTMTTDARTPRVNTTKTIERDEPMIITDEWIDQVCGKPSMTFNERLADDERRMRIRERWTGSVV